MFFLYVIAHLNEDDDFIAPVKIGVTNDLARRVKEIQTGNPVKVALYTSVPFTNEKLAYDAERKLHELNEIVAMQGEWFDTEPQNVFERFFSKTETKEVMLTNLHEHIKKLEWDISTLQIALWEQEQVIESIFRSEMKDKENRIFNKYSSIMCGKYKELLSLIEKTKSGKNKDGLIWGTPYWLSLAKRQQF